MSSSDSQRPEQSGCDQSPDTAHRHLLTLALAAVSAVTLSALVGMALRQRYMRTPPNDCPFGDGIAYCNMASGRNAPRPWSQRPFVPFVARIIRAVSGWSLVDSFLAIELLGFVLTIAALVALGYVIAHRAGVRREAHAIVLLAVMVWGLTPFALRFVLTAPTLTDELATALTVAWLAALFWPTRERGWIIGPIIALLATTAREAAFVTILVTCVVALALRIVRSRDVYANCAAAALALAFDFTRPTAGTSQSDLGITTFRSWLHHPGLILPALFMGVGFAVVALLPTALVRVTRRLPDARYIYALLPAALVPLVLSPVSGVDHARIVSPAAPLLCILFAFYVALVADTAQICLLAIAAAVFIHEWQPFGVLKRITLAYPVYFSGFLVFRGATVAFLGVIALVLALLDFWHLRSPSRKPRSATSRSSY